MQHHHSQQLNSIPTTRLVTYVIGKRRNDVMYISDKSQYYCSLFVYEIIFWEELRKILERCDADVERLVYPFVDLNITHGDNHPWFLRRW